MKKGIKLLSFVLLSLFAISFLASIALAQTVPENIANSLKSLFEDKAYLSRILLTVLLYMILYSIVSVVFKGGQWLTGGITLIITILATIFIPSNFIEAITLQYGAMGAAILTVIPFIIMLVFSLRIQSTMAGKVLWLFYTIYYGTLFIYKIFSIEGQIEGQIGWLSAESIPYWGAIIGGVVMFLFITPIKGIIVGQKLKQIKEEGKTIALRGKILHELQKEELEESYGGK